MSDRSLPESVLSIRDLSVHYGTDRGELNALLHVNLDVPKGSIVGVVGESGCGKSTLGRTLLRLYEPTKGEVFFEESDLFALSSKEVKKIRRKMQMIFQDPYASLNPRMTVEEIVGEALDIHKLARGKRRKERISQLLELVGLKPAHLSRFPHEFSGGQRQRIGIARALAVEPKFIVCDEPISALDVSIQAQVVNLLKELQKKMGLTYLFIAHDLSMVEYISDRVAVMYLGHLVELASSDELYHSPLHPYTQALLSAIPIPDPKIEKERQRIRLSGDVPSAIQPPPGCVFHTRCPFATDICRKEKPSFEELKPGHFVACHHAE